MMLVFYLIVFLSFSVPNLGEIRIGLGHVLVHEGQVDVTTAKWSIVGDVNLEFFQNVLTVARKYYSRFANHQHELDKQQMPRNLTKIYELYRAENLKMEELISKLENEIEGILILLGKNNRTKRGLIDIGGELLRVLFGTATVSQVTDLEEVMKSLKNAGVAQQDIISKQMSVVKNLVLEDERQNELLRNITEALLSVEVHWQKVVKIVNSNSNQGFQVSMDVGYLKLHQLINEIRSRLHALEIDLNALASKRLPINMFPPKSWIRTLSQISNKLPSMYRLPVHNSENVWAYYHHFAKTSTFLTSKGLRIVTEIPLVARNEMYDLYKIIPFPTFQNNLPNNLTTVYPSQPFIAIKREERTHFIEISLEDLKECVKIELRICSLFKAVQKKTLKSCNYAIYNEDFGNIERNCVVKFSQPPEENVPILRHIKGEMWVFSARNVDAAISCEDELKERLTLDGSNLFSLPSTCSLFSETFTIPATFSGVTELNLNFGNISSLAPSAKQVLPKLANLPTNVLEQKLSMSELSSQDTEVSLQDLEASFKSNSPVIRTSYQVIEYMQKKFRPTQLMGLTSIIANLIVPVLVVAAYHWLYQKRRTLNGPETRVMYNMSISEPISKHENVKVTTATIE